MVPPCLTIDIVASPAFELANPVANRQGGGNADGNVHMIFNSADFVQVHVLGVEDTLTKAAVRERFDRRCKKWVAVLGVPDNVEVDFAVVVF
jgi:hypothetical protein